MTEQSQGRNPGAASKRVLVKILNPPTDPSYHRQGPSSGGAEFSLVGSLRRPQEKTEEKTSHVLGGPPLSHFYPSSDVICGRIRGLHQKMKAASEIFRVFTVAAAQHQNQINTESKAAVASHMMPRYPPQQSLQGIDAATR
ncbi:hypothetical protein B7463_g9871, partial [Scytalidium lignicola]